MDFPANSHKATDAPKPEPKNVTPVVQGAQRRKPGLGRRFAETFGGGDAHSVGQYILFDVLLPAAKDMVSDAVSGGIDRFLFGDSRPSSRRGRTIGGGSSTGYVNYSRMSGSSNGSMRQSREQSRDMVRRRAVNSPDEILLQTRVEAQEVLDRMNDLIATYEVVTKADLYTLVDISPEFTDGNWGWTDLSDARIHHDRDGYLLDLPKPQPVE